MPGEARDRKLIIRVADVADIGELAAIGSRVFWDSYGSSAPDADIASHVVSFFSEEAIAQEIRRDEVCYLKACDGDNIAGLVKMRDGDMPELVAEFGASSAREVQQLYVSADYQRRGIGALLLNAAVADTRERNIDGVWLSVWSEADWAVNFYVKYGFRSLGNVSFRIADVEYVDELMWLEVG